MGIFDDDDLEELAELKKQAEQFRPLELNEVNVQAIFNRCLATKDTPDSDEQLSILFQKIMGYNEDSKPMVFCKSTIERNKKNTLYLLGQLDSVHKGSREITTERSIFRYDGTQWTSDTVTMMQFYHLAEAVHGISPFIKKYNVANTEPIIKPTLSPKDPNFPAWWAAHRAEWED